jgi:hypothetical protein
MLAALLSFAIVIAVVLGLGTGAALTLGGSLTAVVATEANGRRVRGVAIAVAFIGLLLFFASMFTCVHLVPLA